MTNGARYCAECGAPLVQGCTENQARFSVRRYCNRQCACAAQSKIMRAKSRDGGFVHDHADWYKPKGKWPEGVHFEDAPVAATSITGIAILRAARPATSMIAASSAAQAVAHWAAEPSREDDGNPLVATVQR